MNLFIILFLIIGFLIGIGCLGVCLFILAKGGVNSAKK